MNKGALIVIDGSDGSGKSTQLSLLKEHLQRDRLPFHTVSFPRYNNPSAAMVELYLKGELGSKELTNNPYLVSTFYAADRYLHAAEISSALQEGKIVISDRYVSSNMGHQGGKIMDQTERRKFFEWLYDYEYIKLGIPIPNLNIILSVPITISEKLIQNRHGRIKDIHEQDSNHLRQAIAVYSQLSTFYAHFTTINCAPAEVLLSPEAIHDLIWEKIKPFIP